MMAPAGVILAGGRGTRMGGADKALLTLGGETLLARVAGRLTPQVAALALNANGDPSRFGAFDGPILADNVPGFPGPLAGVLAGLDWAALRGFDSVVTVAADTPFFPCDLVPRLQAAGEGMAAPLVIAGSGPAPAQAVLADVEDHLTHPTFGLWPVALRDDMRAALGQGVRRMRDWTLAHDARVAVFADAPFDPFFNINTPGDLRAAEQLL